MTLSDSNSIGLLSLMAAYSVSQHRFRLENPSLEHEYLGNRLRLSKEIIILFYLVVAMLK